MAEIQERLMAALQLMMGELLPFCIFRLGVYAASAAIMFVYWVVLLIAAWMLGPLGGVIVLVGIGVQFVGLHLARGYLLYLVQAGHVAVATQVAFGKGLPTGANQVEFARTQVARRFGEVSTLAAVDVAVKSVVQGFNRTVEGVASWLPIPGAQQVARIVTATFGLAARSIDEAVLSLAFLKPDRSVWDTAREGVTLYCQNAQPILMVAAAAAAIEWLGTVTLFCIFVVIPGLPAVFVLGRIWPALSGLGMVLPFLGAYLARKAFFEPWAMTAVLLTFHSAIKGKTVDPDMEATLQKLSPRFADLRAR